MVAGTGVHRQAADAATGKAPASPFLRRPGVRALKAALWAGVGLSGLAAERVRTTWLMHAPAVPGIIAATLFGIGLAGICVAGLEAVRVAARREWRDSGPVILEGGAEVLPEPEDPYQERIAALELASEHSARTLSEVFDLMQIVCDELSVDTSPAARTMPQLRLVPNGEAG